MSPNQKALLKELSMNPAWVALLEDISHQLHRDFRYKPDDKPEDKKHAEWAYRSGVDCGTSNVLKLLGYEQGN